MHMDQDHSDNERFRVSCFGRRTYRCQETSVIKAAIVSEEQNGKYDMIIYRGAEWIGENARCTIVVSYCYEYIKLKRLLSPFFSEYPIDNNNMTCTSMKIIYDNVYRHVQHIEA